MTAAKDREKTAGAKGVGRAETVKGACALAANVLTAVLKFAAGAATLSVSVVVSGFYTLCMTAAKTVCRFRGDKKLSDIYYVAGGFLAFAALFYGAGAVKAFFVPATFAFGLIPALAVATAAFFETGTAVAGMIGAARAKDGIRLTLRRINFSAAVAALSLTQTALLAVSSDAQNSPANAVMGVIAAIVTAAGAVDVFARGRKERKAEKDAAA